MKGLECVSYFMNIYTVNRKLLDIIRNSTFKIDNTVTRYMTGTVLSTVHRVVYLLMYVIL